MKTFLLLSLKVSADRADSNASRLQGSNAPTVWLRLCRAGFLALPVALVLAACEQKSGTPAAATNAASSGSSPLTAPVDYLGAIANAKQQAVKTVDSASLDRAIQMFGVE